MFQVVDLCSDAKLNYFLPSAKATELLAAIQEAAAVHYANPEEKRCIEKLALKLTQLYGEACFLSTFCSLSLGSSGS